jgi:hypothetical protein
MFESTIVWHLIFVNQYFPTKFLTEKVGQVVQAQRQVVLRRCLETNRFKVGLVLRLKRLHETILLLPVEAGN